MVTTAELKNEVQSLCQQPCPNGLDSTSCSGGLGGGDSSAILNLCPVDANKNFTDALGNNVQPNNAVGAIVPIRACSDFSVDPYTISMKGLSFPCNNGCNDGSLCLDGSSPSLHYKCCFDISSSKPCVPGCNNLEGRKFCTPTNMSSWASECSAADSVGTKCLYYASGIFVPGCCITPLCSKYPCRGGAFKCYTISTDLNSCSLINGNQCYVDPAGSSSMCILDNKVCSACGGGYKLLAKGDLCTTETCHDDLNGNLTGCCN